MKFVGIENVCLVMHKKLTTTSNANNKLSSFVPTPWENYAYDANDLAPLTNPNSNVPSSHFYTPKSSLVDALGRTVQTTEHKAHYNATAEHYEDVVMTYRYDIRGNLLAVKDPYNRTVFEHIYDLRPPQKGEDGEQQPLPSLWTQHIDSGESTIVFDATGKVVESEDVKGARVLNSYDILQRPIYAWAKDNSSESFTVRHVIVYGDDENHAPVNPKTTNHLGKPYKNYDDSGLDTILEYDFKGNVVEAQKQVIKDSLLLNAINVGALNDWEVTPYVVDWTTEPWDEETNLIEGNYQTNVVFDALNRPTETTYPADIDNNRKIATTTYNRAGAIEKIAFDGTDYINHIAYNAKGDVILTAYGNGIMTRQLYDNRTFVLKRTRTSSYIQTSWTFADNAGVKEDKIFAFDLMSNILQTHDKCTDCGLSATPDELTRNFSYDPLYRLLNATGRESDTQSSAIWEEAPIAQTPNAQNSRAYTQVFQYDKLGNILKKLHTATGNSYTRRYNYQNGTNKLTDIDNNQSVPTVIANFTYDIVGNQIKCGTERYYEWDYGNRMKAFYNQAGTGVEPSVYAVYLYDGGGNRTKKLVRKQGGSWESVTYIGGSFEYHKKGTEEKNYTQIANVEIRTGSYSGDVSDSVLYQFKDHLGSVGLRINQSGTTIDREEYYPFGDSSLRTFTKKRYRYCGKEKDEESGLYYYGARYYMAWACRFISIDPLASDYTHLTPYNYCNNSPILYTDTDGQKFINPYKEKVTQGEIKLKEAESAYNDFVEKNPNLSKRELKKNPLYGELTSIKSQLKENKSNAELVDNFTNTLKVTNEEEYNYFEKLSDKGGNEISIKIYIVNDQGPSSADGKNFLNAKTTIAPIEVSRDGNLLYYSVDNKTINVTIYEATNVLTGTASTQKYSSFTNELGDIKYYFDKVTDEDSLGVWENSAEGDSANYFSTSGAGEESRQYSNSRVKDVDTYSKKTGYEIDVHGNIQQQVKK